MAAPQVDLRVYALIDPERAGGHGLPELAWHVAAGGATLVQLRDKHGSTRAMVEEARAIRENLAAMRVPFLINDRVDVALAADADGVHVGQDDMAVEDARRLLGPGAIIGLSIKTVEQAETAPVDLLDYVGDRRCVRHHLQGQSGSADRCRRPGAHRAGAAPAPPGAADLRHRGHRCVECGGDHQGGRRRRRGDLGAVARREPARRRA